MPVLQMQKVRPWGIVGTKLIHADPESSPGILEAECRQYGMNNSSIEISKINIACNSLLMNEHCKSFTLNCICVGIFPYMSSAFETAYPQNVRHWEAADRPSMKDSSFFFFWGGGGGVTCLYAWHFPPPDVNLRDYIEFIAGQALSGVKLVSAKFCFL